jgi:hypothetical protein
MENGMFILFCFVASDSLSTINDINNEHGTGCIHGDIFVNVLQLKFVKNLVTLMLVMFI